MQRFAAIVLTYNGLGDTRTCLRSMEAARRPYVETVLVDNGSTDGTAEIIRREFPWVDVLRVEQNQGPSAGYNAGLRAALERGVDWMVLFNNDITVDANVFDRLREAADAHPEYAVLGPVIKFMEDPDAVMTDGSIFNPNERNGFFLRKPVPLTRSMPPAVVEVDVVNSCCIMIRADMVRRIGVFDENFFMYHDETDLCLRVKEAGGKAGVIDHALIWHKGSATSQINGKRSIRYFDARNLLYVLRKHHGAPLHGRSRSQTALAYARYMYYWYCDQKERGNDDAALAVIEGVSDGVLGRTGPFKPGKRLLVTPTRWVFEGARRLLSSPPKAR